MYGDQHVFIITITGSVLFLLFIDPLLALTAFSTAMTTSVFQLECSCNEYPWGKKGSGSLAARLCSKTPGTSFTIDDSKEYSEMWMGDHSVLPAKSLETGQELLSIIDENKEKLLGKRCIEKFGSVLPYLPKVS